jgi:hypothetical protein
VPRSRAVLAALALVTATGSCRDAPTSPTNFAITLSVDAPPTPVITDTPDGPQIKCTFGLTARATGRGSAEWGDVRTFWYFGTDRTTAADTTSNQAAEVQGAFNKASIGGGETSHATWYLYAGAPFEATLGFTYTLADGQSAVASTHITCGPTPQGAVTPVITQITLPVTSGEVKIGDILSVTYHETGVSGIWMSIVDVTGGFISEKVVGEHLTTSVDHTVQFFVPREVKAGIPLTVSVRAFNAALVGAAKSLETQLKYVDRTPPTISAVLDGHNGLAGQYAVGDTISLNASASDDYALGWLVYDLGPPANVHDSVAANPGWAGQYWSIKLPIRPEWVGSPVVSLYARDASGLTSQTVSSQPDSVRIYAAVNRPTTTPLSLSPNATNDIVYDAKRDLMYVGIQNDNHVLVFSPSTMALQAPIVLPAVPMGMDLSLSGDSLLAAVPSTNSIAVVDLSNPSATPGTIRLSLLDNAPTYPGMPAQPSGLRIAANGKMIVMLSNMTTQSDQTVEVDLTTGAQRFRTDTRGPSDGTTFWPQFVGRNGDRSRIYLLWNCWRWYASATDTFSPCGYGQPSDGFGITFDAAGTHLTLGSRVFDADTHLLWSSEAINQIYPYAALSPDGASVYLGAGQGITTMRFADKVMLERIPIPVTAERLFVSPSDAWILAFQNTNGSRVTRVDLR